MGAEGFAKGARPICGFCNAPWTDDMIRVFDVDAYHGPDSYDFGPENQRATVDITCSSCGRLIYRREYLEADMVPPRKECSPMTTDLEALARELLSKKPPISAPSLGNSREAIEYSERAESGRIAALNERQMNYQDGWNAAIEEAAKVCERHDPERNIAEFDPHRPGAIGRLHAHDIRNLKR